MKREKMNMDVKPQNLKYRINENEIIGLETSKMLSSEFNSIDVDVTENNINIEICPTTEEHKTWAYQFNKDLIATTTTLENEQKLVSGVLKEKCEFACNDQENYEYFSRVRRIDGIHTYQISYNNGEVVRITELIQNDYLSSNESYFYSKAEMSGSYTSGLTPNSIGISWKNFRENVSFVYPDVSAGTQASFMTIYSPNAKTKDGKYDPIHTIARNRSTRYFKWENGEINF